jgi:hypothetical protein
VVSQIRHVVLTAPDEIRARFLGLSPITLVRTTAALKPRRTDPDVVRFTTLSTLRELGRRALFAVDGRRGLEELCDGFRCHEAETPQRGEFTDWDAVACDDEGLAFVEAAHDLSAAVPEFSLGHDLTRAYTVARCATLDLPGEIRARRK